MKFMSIRRDLLDPGGLSASQYSFYTSYMPGTLGYSLSTSRTPSVGLLPTPGAIRLTRSFSSGWVYDGVRLVGSLSEEDW